MPRDCSNDPYLRECAEERGEMYYQYQPGDYPPIMEEADEGIRLRTTERGVGPAPSEADRE